MTLLPEKASFFFLYLQRVYTFVVELREIPEYIEDIFSGGLPWRGKHHNDRFEKIKNIMFSTLVCEW